MRLLLLSLLCATPVLAEEFGDRDTVVIDGGDALFAVVDETTVVSLAPAATLFLHEDVSFGLGLSFRTALRSTVSTMTLGARTSIGYNLRLDGRFSLWPRAALAWTRSAFTGGAVGVAFSSLAVELDAHLLFHPTPHFFVGVGPGTSAVLWTSKEPGSPGSTGTPGVGAATQGVSIALSTTFGGWF